jgi:hypothetical protein
MVGVHSIQASVTTYSQIVTGYRCGLNSGSTIEYVWQSNYNADPTVCMELVLARSDCSHQYFNHATNGDGNCRCLTNTAIDCTDTSNQLSDSPVRIYSIQAVMPTYSQIANALQCGSYNGFRIDL